jgi:hypothetical protein
MWPFRKKEKPPADTLSYSQVDTTEAFGDDQRLGADEWITTTPLNATTANPESMGLPPLARVQTKYTGWRRVCPHGESRSTYRTTACTAQSVTSRTWILAGYARPVPDVGGSC